VSTAKVSLPRARRGGAAPSKRASCTRTLSGRRPSNSAVCIAAPSSTALTGGGTSSSSMAAVSTTSATAGHSQFAGLANRLADARERLGQTQPAAHLSDQVVNALVVAWKLRVRLDAVRPFEQADRLIHAHAHVHGRGVIGDDQLCRRAGLVDQRFADQVAAEVGFERGAVEDLLHAVGLHGGAE